MNKTTLTILILAITTICNGQTTLTKYYNNEWLEKEVTSEKGKFSQTVTQNIDGTVTTEVKNVKKNEIIRSETYKGEEPYGIWGYQTSKGTSNLDYNFPLKYSEETCNDSVLNIKINDYFQDVDSLKYKAPKIISGETTIYEFIAKNLIYPVRAREEGTQGKVYIILTITKKGDIENITIKRGANILLDKEAVRVLRELKFSSPPTLNGQSQSLCMVLPVSFRLK